MRPSAKVEEFDDDTEFDLPSAPPAQSAPGGSGMPPDQMAMFQQMMAQMGGSGPGAGPTGAMPPMEMTTVPAGQPAEQEEDDDGPHKDWVAIYPIYLDAKRHYKKGCRRVPYEQAVLYPNSLHIANATHSLGLEFVHQPQRTHPQDWENPGRVKVRLFDENKKPVRRDIATKKRFLEMIAERIQPHAGGKPPALPLRTARDDKQTQRALPPMAARQRAIRRIAVDEPIPPHSPARSSGLINTDLSKAMGGDALKNMGPLGSMLGGMAGDEEEPPEAPQANQGKGQPPLSRRQKKRVVRIAR